MMELVLQSKRVCLLLSLAWALTALAPDLQAVRADEANQEIVDLVLEELKSGDAERQAGAIAIVRDIPGAEITQALAAELPKLSSPVQVQLLSTLADRGDRAALPAVMAAGAYADESVRVAALKAVGQLGHASHVLFLAQRAAETRGAEQAAARESLYRLRGAETDAAILNEIASASAEVKVELIRAVGERNVVQAVRTLLSVAEHDEDRKVRAEAIRTLKIVAGPDDLPSLVDLLLDLEHSTDRSEAEKTVAAVAHKIPDEKRQASVVLAAVDGANDPADRASLLRALGRIGDNGALPALRSFLGSQDAQVRDAAIRALADWPTPEPVDDLLKVAQTADRPVHKVLALRGFVRLVGLRSDLTDQEVIDLYRQAMDLAPNAAEKKRVLSGLSAAKSLGALNMAAGYLDDPALHLEAEAAAVQIAGNLRISHPQQALSMLERVLKATANETIRRQAQETMDRIQGRDSAEPSEGEVDGQ